MPATFYVGDAIEVMGKLPEKSVDLILTSPPFLALRSYLPADHPDKALEGGSQSTPGDFIDWLLDVVEACDRVLAPHGSLCIELGDTYSGTGGAGGDWSDSPATTKARVAGGSDGGPTRRNITRGGLSKPLRKPCRHDRYEEHVTYACPHPQGHHPSILAKWKCQNDNQTHCSGGESLVGDSWPLAKSLSLIPESFRWAMVYGRNPHTGRTTEPWRLRNVIRWVRPNPPVGALGDKFRPATSELMVFCKSAKRYFDLDSVREPYKEGTLRQYKADPGDPVGDQRPTAGQGPKEKVHGWQQEQRLTHSGAPPLDWWNIPLLGGEEETRYGTKERSTQLNPGGAPPLDWWEIPPGGYQGSHYAVFPPELCVKPVKAMCPEKVCRVCGEPSRRIVGEATYERDGELVGALDAWPWGGNEKGRRGERKSNDGGITRQAPTLGFSDCGHDDWRSGLVLDPFAGSGTTLAVATGHGRDAIGIDLDARNFDLALERVGPFMLERRETPA